MQPSAEEYRRRYLENIQKLLLTQSKLVNFSATIKAKDRTSDGAGGVSGVCVGDILPSLPLGEGRLVYDLEMARAQPVDCNLRVLRSLWTGACVCVCVCVTMCVLVSVCVRVSVSVCLCVCL